MLRRESSQYSIVVADRIQLYADLAGFFGFPSSCLPLSTTCYAGSC